MQFLTFSKTMTYANKEGRTDVRPLHPTPPTLSTDARTRETRAHASSKTDFIVKHGTSSVGKYATRVAHYAECMRRENQKKWHAGFCHSQFAK